MLFGKKCANSSAFFCKSRGALPHILDTQTLTFIEAFGMSEIDANNKVHAG